MKSNILLKMTMILFKNFLLNNIQWNNNILNIIGQLIKRFNLKHFLKYWMSYWNSSSSTFLY